MNTITKFLTIRFCIINFALICVLSIGIPYGGIDHFAYSQLMFFGLDVPMTPITHDMSMMIEDEDTKIYEMDFSLFATLSNHQQKQIDASMLDIYQHKITIMHYHELLNEGVICDECRYYLCHNFSSLLDEKISNFSIQLRPKTNSVERMGQNEIHECNF